LVRNESREKSCSVNKPLKCCGDVPKRFKGPLSRAGRMEDDDGDSGGVLKLLNLSRFRSDIFRSSVLLGDPSGVKAGIQIGPAALG
jgi:hypothetical protein